jgi:hypothetical protein
LEKEGVQRFFCPYLGEDVELTAERRYHIVRQHPEMGANFDQVIKLALNDPDQVRRSRRMGSARLFSRWFADIRGGKHAVIVVVSEVDAGRSWIITAYLARRLVEGEVEWSRD